MAGWIAGWLAECLGGWLTRRNSCFFTYFSLWGGREATNGLLHILQSPGWNLGFRAYSAFSMALASVQVSLLQVPLSCGSSAASRNISRGFAIASHGCRVAPIVAHSLEPRLLCVLIVVDVITTTITITASHTEYNTSFSFFICSLSSLSRSSSLTSCLCACNSCP